MKVTLTPTVPSGKIKAIASKSAAHRLLICAAFSDKLTEISCEEKNDDINATVRCLSALGAKITEKESGFSVLPIRTAKQNALLDCGESGSTLRFLVPVVAALGCGATFKMSGRLPERPLSPLSEVLTEHGAVISVPEKGLLSVSGRISCGEYSIQADVSSQFISGLLFALTLCEGESTLTLIGKKESAQYIEMTLDALYEFGALPVEEEDRFIISGRKKLISPQKSETEGDWSNAAFALCAGAISKKGKISVYALDPESSQGDRAIIELLVKFGADVRRKGDCFTVKASPLYGIDIDASQIPDLVPILAVTAAAANGETRIYNAERLRIKESDRLKAVSNVLSTLGADITETDDGLIIQGGKTLRSAELSSFGDHRIAMSAAVASILADGPVTVNGAECVSKSYPSFWRDLAALGVQLNETEE